MDTHKPYELRDMWCNLHYIHYIRGYVLLPHNACCVENYMRGAEECARIGYKQSKIEHRTIIFT